MNKIWKDFNEPSDTSLIWQRLNENGHIIAYFQYKNGEWVVINKKDLKNLEDTSTFDSLINGAPEELDTLGEIATALSSKEDKISGKGLSTNDFTNADKEAVEQALPLGVQLALDRTQDMDTIRDGAAAGATAYQKPQTGIPASDLASGVIPDVSGKENTSNKVTSLSAQSTDTQYPSAKAVVDYVDDAVDTPVESTQPSGGFLPNVVYDLGTLTESVTFALAAGVTGKVNAYHWTFDTGSTAPTITWPANIIWPDDVTPTVDANKHYEVLVRNGYASILVFSLSA